MPFLAAEERSALGPVGALPADRVTRAPSALDTMAAAFRQNHLASSLYERLNTRANGRELEPIEGYDPLDDIAGFEDHAERFLDSESPAETARVKQRIRSEHNDQRTLQQAGGWGLAAAMAAGTVDPTTLAAIAIPAAAPTRLATMGRAALTSAALDVGAELALHATQETRTLEQSAINVGAGAILSGLLGAAIAPRISRQEFDGLLKQVDADLRAHTPTPAFEGSTAGAAARGFQTTLEQETIARGGETIAKTIGRISPLNRLLTSPSKEARQLAQDLAETPYALTKNEAGIATPTAVETLTKRYDALLVRFTSEMDRAYKAYRKRAKAAGEPVLKFRQFREDVAGAMRRGDQSMTPEVAEVARVGRNGIIEPLKNKLIRAKLLPEEIETVGAMSYLPRLYNVLKIKANRAEWEETLTRWFTNQAVDPVEAKGLVQTVTTNILGSTRGFVEMDPNVVVKAGALKERTLVVPDEVLEPWLINDVEQVLSRYVRSVAPQIEISNRFGELDLKQRIQNVVDEYGVLQERAAGNNKQKAKLEDRLKTDLNDLRGIRDRILGVHGLPADPDSVLVRGARVLRDYSYVRLLGSQVLSSIADVGRIVTQNGLVGTGKGLVKFATRMAKWKLARADAKRLGIGLDWTLNTRGATLAEIGDYAETTAEKISQKFANKFSRVTGMSTWNSTMKFLATALEQDSILDLGQKVIAGHGLTRNQRTKLAQGGIDEPMLKRIAQEFAQHGETEGLRRARSALWTDTQARDAFEGAMIKAADTMVLTKGAGDTPLLMSYELAKTLLQFKGFGMAAVSRLLIPAAQGLARGDVAMMNGLLVMLTLGVMRYVSKQWTSDQPIELDPKRLIIEAIDGSGLSTWLLEPYDTVAGMTGLPRASRYTDRTWQETLLGPTAGSFTELGRTVEGIARDGVSQRDIHQFRKLAPYQNVFYLRRGINALEDEAGDALGVPEQAQ